VARRKRAKRVPKPAPKTVRKAGLTTAEWVYLSLSGLAVVISLLKAPIQPINDSAQFELFGRAMLHGQHLYTDLRDNKLPGIFLINLGYQALFGTNYFLHNCAGAAINLASFALFALMLRRLQVAAWAFGTFLFAVFFSIPYATFNFGQHYAVFFIVLGLYLGFRRADFWGGLALLVATTFWIPAVLMWIPIVAQRLERRRLLAFAAGFASPLALAAAVGLALNGPSVALFFPKIWTSYVENSVKYNIKYELGFNLTHSAMLPSLAVLLALLVMVIRKPIAETSRFGLIWSACALVGSLIPPNFSEHYYLPSIPALAMAIASFGIAKKDFIRRPDVAVVAAIALVIAGGQTVHNALIVREASAYVQVLGNWIRDSVGSDANVYPYNYFPDIQLAAEARNTGPVWKPGQPIPDVIVAGPRSLSKMVRTRQAVGMKFGSTRQIYVPACPRNTGGMIAIYTLPSRASGFDCARIQQLILPLMTNE